MEHKILDRIHCQDARTAKGVICSMKFHERIFRAVCKASVYILISAFCVGIVWAVISVFIEYPAFVLSSATFIAAVVLVLNGWTYLDEDWKKREEQLKKEIEQLEREVKKEVENE